jgi:Ca-activated chloride channel family protein
LMNIKLSYKEPAEDTSTAFEVPVRRGKAPATGNLGFAAAVAEFGMLLRDSPYKARASWRQAEMLATDNRGEDLDGYRAEFIRLLGVASTLERRPSATLGR